MAFVRSLIFFSGYATLTLLYGSTTLFIWLLPNLVAHRFITSWTTIIIWWLKVTCGVKYVVKGRENIPSDAGFVVLSKHQSAWETLFLQTLFWPATTILKKELLNIPFFGWGLRVLKPVPIDRSNPRLALKQVKTIGSERLQEGFNIILFPEGTRMPVGEKGTYARSGADIASNANVPIVPVAVNAGACWPPKRFVKYPGTVIVSIGPSISAENRSSKEVMADVENWIENEMASHAAP
ncbi:1-acyl-sn-glycerol-3-phosphate acyltransferase [Thalassocella blandensis]|nr:1-acyl-sn-glycerol-3-phosphate acyltransferase [Thalassocella blandensis]